jgi:hypothetical protein
MGLGRIVTASQAQVWTSLLGHWQGEGKVRGMSADVSLQFQPLLAGAPALVSQPDAWREHCAVVVSGRGRLSMRRHIELPRPGYDSRGEKLSLIAGVDETRLTVAWGDAQTERGGTTYQCRRMARCTSATKC